MRSKKTNSGFTLAEVLITLGIIGVVAAMTLPGLIQNYKEKEFVSMWKKFYSDLSNAALLMSKNGENLEGETEMVTAFSKYIKHNKICEANKDVEQGCWKEGATIYSYDGKIMIKPNLGSVSGGAACMTLLNGGTFCIDGSFTYRTVIIDVNGPLRPNRMGQDIYFAVFNSEKLQVRPAKGYHLGWGAADGHFVEVDEGNGTCLGDKWGYGCSAEKLLK